MEVLEKECCICSYHVYSTIWDAEIGQQVPCVREPHNESNQYATAAVKDDVVVGYLPRAIARGVRGVGRPPS